MTTERQIQRQTYDAILAKREEERLREEERRAEEEEQKRFEERHHEDEERFAKEYAHEQQPHDESAGEETGEGEAGGEESGTATKPSLPEYVAVQKNGKRTSYTFMVPAKARELLNWEESIFLGEDDGSGTAVSGISEKAWSRAAEMEAAMSEAEEHLIRETPMAPGRPGRPDEAGPQREEPPVAHEERFGDISHYGAYELTTDPVEAFERVEEASYYEGPPTAATVDADTSPSSEEVREEYHNNAAPEAVVAMQQRQRAGAPPHEEPSPELTPR